MPDPAELLLRRSWAGGTDDLRASAWDAFHSASSPDELASSLKGLSLPDELKADLWDLKAGQLGGKTVSAEDFAPAPRDVSIGNILWEGAKSVGSGLLGAGKIAAHAALGTGKLLSGQGVSLDDPLAQDIRNLGEAHRAQAMQALAATRAGARASSEGDWKEALMRGAEAGGHTLAAAFPLLGPSAAGAGEDIGSGDPERIERGGGNAIALVGSAVAPAIGRTVGPRVAPPLASIGEQLASKGKVLATKAGPAASELVKTVGLEGAAHMAGMPPGVVTAIRMASKVKDALERAKAVAPEVSPNVGGRLVKVPVRATAESAIADALAEAQRPELPQSVELPPPAELPPGYEPRTSAPEPTVSPNVGGRLAGKAPTLAQQLADSLEVAKRQEPPARVTLPPPADLPPGYTPRTTVPKPKATVGAAPKAKPTASMGEKNYFLRKKPATTVEEPTAELADAQAAQKAISPEDAIGVFDKGIPKASKTTVDGLTVGDHIPNLSSIESSLDDYHELPGVREVPMDMFDPNYKVKPYSASESSRLDKLTGEIQANKRIDPLIVVIDKESHPYILEGGHRYDALRRIGAKSVPAKVVLDMSEDTGAHLSSAAQPKVAPKSSGPIDVADLPVSWRSRTGPTEHSSLTAADVATFRQKMRESGISTAEAIRAVTQDKTLPPNTRLELISALKKAARKVS